MIAVSPARDCGLSCLLSFRAGDGIPGGHVTGVQTCALPVVGRSRAFRAGPAPGPAPGVHPADPVPRPPAGPPGVVLLAVVLPVLPGGIRLAGQFLGPVGLLAEALGGFLCPFGLLLGPLEPVLRLLRSEEHTSELQSRGHLVCRLLLEKKKN